MDKSKNINAPSWKWALVGLALVIAITDWVCVEGRVRHGGRRQHQHQHHTTTEAPEKDDLPEGSSRWTDGGVTNEAPPWLVTSWLGPSNSGDEPDKRFVGHGARINKDFMLMHEGTFKSVDKQAPEPDANLFNAKFQPQNIFDNHNPSKIDVGKGMDSGVQKLYNLEPIMGNINNTGIGIFKRGRDIKNHMDLPADMTDSEYPALERDPNNFGSNCRMGGYSRNPFSLSGRRKRSSNATEDKDEDEAEEDRAHHYQIHPVEDTHPHGKRYRLVKMRSQELSIPDERSYTEVPLNVDPSSCANGVCTLSPKERVGGICPGAGDRGAPVYCGPDKKLTYMATGMDGTGEDCDRNSFSAVHLPSIMGNIDHAMSADPSDAPEDPNRITRPPNLMVWNREDLPIEGGVDH